eukprot:229507-Chlamydomonas_euryale.AAC.4
MAWPGQLTGSCVYLFLPANQARLAPNAAHHTHTPQPVIPRLQLPDCTTYVAVCPAWKPPQDL